MTLLFIISEEGGDEVIRTCSYWSPCYPSNPAAAQGKALQLCHCETFPRTELNFCPFPPPLFISVAADGRYGGCCWDRQAVRRVLLGQTGGTAGAAGTDGRYGGCCWDRRAVRRVLLGQTGGTAGAAGTDGRYGGCCWDRQAVRRVLLGQTGGSAGAAGTDGRYGGCCWDRRAVRRVLLGQTGGTAGAAGTDRRYGGCCSDRQAAVLTLGAPRRCESVAAPPAS